MAENYIPIVNDVDADAARFNAPLQNLDDAIEDIVDGSKALTAPDIDSFANAQHGHSNAAGGGAVLQSNLDTTGGSDGDVFVANGSGGGSYQNNLSLPPTLRMGLNLRRIADGSLLVRPGCVVVDDTMVIKNTATLMNLVTDANWIGGSSLESASEWVHVYVDSDGNLKFYDKMTNYPVAATASRVFDAQVKQAGWDGTDGQGLNSSSFIYDNDTGEGDVLAGMYLLVYDDSGFTQGRGKGSGAAAAITNLSVARITGINTGTDTITLEAGHHIAINDDDYVIAVEPGPLLYAYISSTWWRWLGALWNDASSNLVAANNQYGQNRRHNAHNSILDESAFYTTTSTTFEDVDGTELSLSLLTMGGDVQIGFTGFTWISGTAAYIKFDVEMDGARLGGDEGLQRAIDTAYAAVDGISFTHHKMDVLPGTHEFNLQWCVAGTTPSGKLAAGDGTVNVNSHPQFWAREVSEALV